MKFYEMQSEYTEALEKKIKQRKEEALKARETIKCAIQMVEIVRHDLKLREILDLREDLLRVESGLRACIYEIDEFIGGDDGGAL